MALSAFDICSNALVQIGASAITDFEGGSEESEVCSYLYQPTVDNWMSMYPWRFATRQKQLSRLSDEPDMMWDAAYAQPDGMITLQAVQVSDVNVPFDRFENKIYCNATSADVVIATYTYSISEAYWPPYFVELIELALMHKLSFALPSKLDMKQLVKSDLEIQYRMAKAADQRQQSSRVLPMSGRGSIIEARRGDYRIAGTGRRSS